MKLIIISFTFWFLETWYFGWNMTPSCLAERICDGLVQVGVIYGMFLYGVKKGKEGK